MERRRIRRAVAWLIVCLSLSGPVRVFSAPQTTAAPLPEQQRQVLTQQLSELKLLLLQSAHRESPAWADAAVFAKAVEWGLTFDQKYTAADVDLLNSGLRRCRERLDAINNESSATAQRPGKSVLGFQSAVDDSVQPYGLIVPDNYNPNTPMRLDVVLHGSSRPVGMSELRFMARFDEGDTPETSHRPAVRAETAASPSENSVPTWIELHPLGRVENCYRWAGETDVFEAIENVCRRYNIDRSRIVLRGMSMGASGTWHLGLKHPDRFAALGPYCGYVDTHRFSETPIPNFIRVGPLPAHQELGLHLLDSVDYAANAGVVPTVACMGEKDVFFQAHVLMEAAMQREGLVMTNLISPGTGHVIDPVTQADQLRRIAEHLNAGPRRPTELRFVTWSLKYSRCHWLEILKLNQHYSRAEVRAHLADQMLVIDTVQNIQRFAVDLELLPSRPKRLKVGDAVFETPAASRRLYLELFHGHWSLSETESGVPSSAERHSPEKRPGLQGPIDDAFCTPFLCVRGTGTPWNATVQSYSDRSLQRFSAEWKQYFRGDLPVKDDTDVTVEDIERCNLILFGDPGSNSLIARVLPALPIEWTRESLTVNGRGVTAETHLPALIYPNPLSSSAPDQPSLAPVPHRYVVLNSGHTFRKEDLAAFNYLLFPRWGDWALLKLDESSPAATDSPLLEHVLDVGYFDEEWQFP